MTLLLLQNIWTTLITNNTKERGLTYTNNFVEVSLCLNFNNKAVCASLLVNVLSEPLCKGNGL